MAHFRVSASDAPVFGADKTQADFCAFFDEFADFAATAGFNWANTDNVAGLKPGKTTLAKLGIDEATFAAQNSQMWGILRTSVKNHTEVKNMVGKHRSDYAAAMTALAMWAMGDCWSSKNELRKQIDKLFEKATTLKELSANLLVIDKLNDQIAKMPKLDEEDFGAYPNGELKLKVMGFFVLG